MSDNKHNCDCGHDHEEEMELETMTLTLDERIYCTSAIRRRRSLYLRV